MIRLTGHMTRYGPGFRMGPHADGCRRLSVLVAGDQEETHRRACVQSGFGSVAIKDPEVVHQNVFGPAGTTIVSVQLPDATLEALGFEPGAIARWRWQDHEPARLTGCRFAAGLRMRQGPLVEECLLELLARFSSTPPPAENVPSERLQRVRDRLRDEPDSVPSVRELAAGEGLHPVSLGRAFHRAFGMSITQYRQRVRIAAVARALLDGPESLVAVALDHGFADSSHLSRVFRREVGVPPGVFQARLRPSANELHSFKTEWALDV